MKEKLATSAETQSHRKAREGSRENKMCGREIGGRKGGLRE